MWFERPWAWALAAVVVPLLIWWHRRARRPRRVQASTLEIWRAVAGGVVTGHARRAASFALLLEIAFALAAIAALTGPVRSLERTAPMWTVIVDRRPAMGARTGAGETRLSAGIRELGDWCARAGVAEESVVVTVPPGPRAARGLAALADVTVAARPAAPGALEDRVLQSLAPGRRVVVLTDRERPASIPAAVRWLAVGESAANVGIVWVRIDDDTLSVGVMNGGTTARDGTLAMFVGEASHAEWPISLAPGAVWSRRVTRPAGASVTLRLLDEDALEADDVVTVSPTGSRIQVVATTPIPGAARRAIEALGVPTVDVFDAAEASASEPALFWNRLPATDWRAPILVIDPPAGRWGGVTFTERFVVHRVAPGPAAKSPAARPPSIERSRRITTADDWRTRQLAIDADGRSSPCLLEREDATILAFDPVRDAPGWPRALSPPSFPACFYHAFRPVLERQTVGLLSGEDTRLGVHAAIPPVEPPAFADTRPTTKSLAPWALIAALLALAGLYAVKR